MLIVDDDDFLLDTLVEGLRLQKWEVNGVESGDAALEACRLQHWDLVLTDLKMAGLDGLDLINRIHDRNPHQRVMLMSGQANPEDTAEAYRRGAVDFIQKPFGIQELIGRVGKHLNHTPATVARKPITSGNAPLRPTTSVSLQFLERMLANLPGIVYRCQYNRSWTREYLSGGCRELTGYAPAELMEKKSDEFLGGIIHPEDAERVCDHIKKAVRDRNSYHVEYRITTTTGDTKWVVDHGRGVYGDNGKPVAVEGTILDCTETKLA